MSIVTHRACPPVTCGPIPCAIVAPVAIPVPPPEPEPPEPVVNVPIILNFRNDAKVIQFLTTEPGTSFARLVDFDLGGDYTVVKGDDRSAIYNAHDDKMYFLASKDSVEFLVQYDPRMLAISDEMELPAPIQGEPNTLIDCTDERAWVHTAGSPDIVRAFDIVSMTQVFEDGGQFGASPYATFSLASISCASGQILLCDEDQMSIHRITITGPTTFVDDGEIVLTSVVTWANNGSFRRRWNAALDKAIVSFEDSGLVDPPFPIGAIVDVAGLTATDIVSPVTGTTLFNNGIYWDTVSNKFVASVVIFGISYGIGVFNADGIYVGLADSTADWDSGSPAMPLGNNLVWSMSLVINGAGGFDMVTPGTTPVETYEATSFDSVPSSLFFDSIHASVAPILPT